MIVAVPAEEKSLDSAICVSFGRAPIYCLYDTEKKRQTPLLTTKQLKSQEEPESKPPNSSLTRRLTA